MDERRSQLIRRGGCVVIAAAATLHATGSATAQVVINEVLHNPPGASPIEEHWEYIELWGRPGLSLDGLAVLLINGGEDRDRNGTPEIEPHLDEAFTLDNHALGPEGLFTLYNASAAGESDVAAARWGGGPREHASSFIESSLDRNRTPGRLANEGSTTYLLVRLDETERRLVSELATSGAVVDEDFDGVLDLQPLRELQILDALAWSHRGGREYTPTTDDELSETVGLNPDAATRIAYLPPQPRLGHRTINRTDDAGRVTGYEVVPTSRADESYVYGVLDGALFPDYIEYFDGYDFEGWKQLYAPTDVAALAYPLSVADPEPDHKPFGPPIRPSREGSMKLDDLPVAGMRLTPHAMNAHPSGGVSQRAFIAGDGDFDGVITEKDVEIARACVGMTMSGAPALQLHKAQTVLAVLWSRPADDPWSTRISERHVAAIQDLVNDSDALP